MLNVVNEIKRSGVSDTEAFVVATALESLGKGTPDADSTTGRLTKRSRSSPNLHEISSPLANLHQMSTFQNFVHQQSGYSMPPQLPNLIPAKQSFMTPSPPNILRKPSVGNLIVQEISPFVSQPSTNQSNSNNNTYEDDNLTSKLHSNLSSHMSSNAVFHSGNGQQQQVQHTSNNSAPNRSGPSFYQSSTPHNEVNSAPPFPYSPPKPFTTNQILILQQPDDLCVVGEHRICQSRISVRPCDVQDLSVYVVPAVKPSYIIPEAIRYKSIQYSSKNKAVVIKLSFPGMMEFSQILKHDFPAFDGKVMLLYRHPAYPDTHSKEFKLISKLPSNQSKKRSRKEVSPTAEYDE